MPDGKMASDALKAQLIADGLVVREGENWRLTEAGEAQLDLLRQIEGERN